MNKHKRMLLIEHIIVKNDGKERVNAERLAFFLGCPVGAIYRDVRSLQAIGIPIAWDIQVGYVCDKAKRLHMIDTEVRNFLEQVRKEVV